jgi:hypothetical protein
MKQFFVLAALQPAIVWVFRPTFFDYPGQHALTQD